jgi:hypothetical protein
LYFAILFLGCSSELFALQICKQKVLATSFQIILVQSFYTFVEAFLIRTADAFEVDRNAEQRINSPAQPAEKGTVVPARHKL